MRKLVVLAMALMLIATQRVLAQAAPARAEAARTMQASLRDDGCSGCRVWVSGPESRTVHVLDMEALTKSNDYKQRPTYWYNVGFSEVIYYSSPGVVYARHSNRPVTPAPQAPSSPSPRKSTPATEPSGNGAAWEACIRRVTRREAAAGATVNSSAMTATIECAPLLP